MENVYTVTVVVCLVGNLFINWYEKMDLSFGDLLMFTMASIVPVVNVVFLVYMVITAITHLDITDIPTITLLRGKE
jgi:hypothetical protein